MSAVVALLVAAFPASAVGYWNMPTTMCQWWGYGCGPGYHAPMVLGPISTCGVCGCGKEIRLPYSPRPHYGCCYDCCGYGCGAAQPSVVEPPPALLPQTEPEPVTPRAVRFPSPQYMLQ